MPDAIPAAAARRPSPAPAKAPSRFNLWFVGALGALFTAGALGTAVWGELRAVSLQRTLAEGERTVQEASADPVQPVQDGHLVHVSGPASIGGTLADPAFPAVRAPHAALLRRTVETFSWHEHRHSDKDGTSYSYSQDWGEGVEDSLRFNSPSGHVNQPAEFASLEQLAQDVRLGARHVSAAVLEALPADGAVVPSAGLRAGSQVADGMLYLGGRPESPRNGDQRIRWAASVPAVLSVVAGQQGADLVPYRASTGQDLALIAPREASAAALMREAQDRGDQEAWWWRLWCGVFAALDVLILLASVSGFGGWFPLLGRMSRMPASLRGLLGLVLAAVGYGAILEGLVAGASLLVMGQVLGAGLMAGLAAAGVAAVAFVRAGWARQARSAAGLASDPDGRRDLGAGRGDRDRLRG